MTRTSDLGLVSGSASGDQRVHLFHEQAQEALCSRPRHQAAPGAGFRAAPCGACLVSALERGHVLARDVGNSFINLRRLATAVMPV